MVFDADAVRRWSFGTVRHRWSSRDTMLYGLGLGLGQDPCSDAELQYVYGPHLKAFPTMAVVLGHPGSWLADPATGVDYSKVVQGENYLEIFAPIPTDGEFLCENKVLELIDKGAGKAAIVTVGKSLVGKASGALIARQRSTLFLRGHGGFGGETTSRFASLPAAPLERPADVLFNWTLPSNIALIYRLSGDMNPLHADPAVARDAGFSAPILHGLALFGIFGFAAVSSLGNGRAGSLRELGCRFAAPVYPGETVEFSFWRSGDGRYLASARACERDVTILSNGIVRLDGGDDEILQDDVHV